jgi:hypothetical protein
MLGNCLKGTVMHDEEYPVLTQFRGKLDYVKIAELRDDKWGRSALLAEPFGSRMGWFSFEDLLRGGRAESQGYKIYTEEFWKSNRDAEIARCLKQWFPQGPFVPAADANEAEHRRLIALPTTGVLLKSEIERAFKICARSAHPDSGGSNEQFQKLAAAKEALVQRWQR